MLSFARAFGAMPSSATAIDCCAVQKMLPLSDPPMETSAPTVINGGAQAPIPRTASANGEVEDASCPAGISSITAAVARI